MTGIIVFTHSPMAVQINHLSSNIHENFDLPSGDHFVYKLVSVPGQGGAAKASGKKTVAISVQPL